ncbi:trypsin-like peptidase domain-containing protein [bacterium]|nr:trypsin-like peptidase domain-containing protein [candidate division CSSED10-310 bacterium]
MSGPFISFSVSRLFIIVCMLNVTAPLFTVCAHPVDDETLALVSRARDGIVNIEAKIGISDRMGPFGKALSAHLTQRNDLQQKWYLSLGSGVIWDDKGHIVTTKSVVKTADFITVRSSKGNTFRAKLIGSDDVTNLAVLTIDTPLPDCFMPMTHRTMKLPEGSWLVLMGYGYGGLPTISPGMAGVPPEDFDPSRHWFQFTAPLRPGNSGGALIDSNGHLAGIALGREEDIGFNAVVKMLTSHNQQNFSPSQVNSYSSLGVGVPINQVHPVVEQIIRSGRVIRGWIGVSVQAQKESESTDGGLRVVRIIPGSPAENAGLSLGDGLLCVNGMDVRDPRDLGRMIQDLSPGTRVPIDFIREGKNLRTEVVIQERPAQKDLIQEDESSKPDPLEEPSPSDSDTGLASDE